MPSNCKVEFDHSNGVYHSGETISGIIKLKTETPKTIRGISVTTNGYAKVQWDERKSRQTHGKKEYYTVTSKSYDHLLNSKTFVAGSEEGNSYELPPGTYNYSFNCYLPLSLPTSVVGKYGIIKYEVIVKIHRLLKIDNVFKTGFTIIHELNLHLHPEYKSPKSAIAEKEFGCKCCCLGNVGMARAKLEIPFGGYAPGQKISFTLSISNNSESDLVLIRVKLEKRIIYEASNPSVTYKKSEYEIDVKKFPNVLRLSRKQYQGFFKIPAIPPSTLANLCFRIDYKLSVMIVNDAFCDDNIDLSIPIIIVTVPLPVNAADSQNVIINQPTAPIATGSTNTEGSPPGYETVAPSSYEDGMVALEQFDDNEIDSTNQEAQFVPKYPEYNNYELPSTSSTSFLEETATETDTIQESPTMALTTYGWDIKTS